MKTLIDNFSALLYNFEKLLGAQIYFHDYHQIFLKSIAAKHHNHTHSFCLNYKEKNLPKCMKFEGDTSTDKSYKHPEGFWKICHANALELYIPLIHPINKTKAGAMFVGVFQPVPKSLDMLIAIEREEISVNHSLLPFIKPDKMVQIYQCSLLLKYFIENEILIQSRSIENTFDRKEKIVYYLNENIKKNISLGTLAGFLKVSYSRAGQIIKENFSQSFPELLLEIRMDQARSLLSGSDMKIIKISQECGFKEPEYFHKLFKNKFNMTPIEYRKQNLNKSQILDV